MRLFKLAAVGAVALLAVAVPAHAQKFDYQGAMTGAEVVPGPGDPDGTGTFTISIDNATNTLCYGLAWQNTEEPQGSHIHTGSANQAGQIMVDLNLPANGPKACIPIDATSAGHITSGPKSHYVDLHTASQPEGAVRGQLQR